MRCSNRAIVQTASIVIIALAGLLTPQAANAQSSSDALLRRMDANGNGRLESNEVPSQYRLIIDRAARKAGLDPSKPISIEQLKRGLKPSSEGDSSRDERHNNDRRRDDRAREHTREQRGRGRDRHSWGDGSRSTKPKEAVTGVPGFGIDDDRPPVAGFDGLPLDNRVSTLPLEEQYEAKVLEYVDHRLLGPHDRDKDGFLDREEMKRVPWADDPKQDDVNGDGRLSRSDLAGRMARRWHYGRKKIVVSSGGSKPQASVSFSSASKGSSNGLDERYKKYAASLLKRYDKNKNGFLERDEWKQMRGEPEKGDRNRDGRITADELAAHLAGYASRKEKESKSSSSKSKDGNRDRRSRWSGRPREGEKSAERKTYRFSSPTERLPRKLPSWFKEKDTNADGQVAMAEYSSVWSEPEVAMFKKNDLNGDGLITPRECLIAGSMPSKPTNSYSKPASSASSPSKSPQRSAYPKRSSR